MTAYCFNVSINLPLEAMMIDPEALRQVLSDTFHSSIHDLNITKHFGDASSRIYYRLVWQDEGTSRSTILMVMADLEAAKTSEEKGSNIPTSNAELPFINIQKHLASFKIPVPEIYFYDKKLRWLILEDLRDTTLFEVIRAHPKDASQWFGYYKNAIHALISIQLDASPRPNPPTQAHRRHFDQSLFEWEFEHFLEYGIEQRMGVSLTQKKREAIQGYFSEISARLAALPQVFTHRDYHSRNLMIQSGPPDFEISLIDFQDALMGPAQYDLASLLRDSYVILPEETIDALLEYYLENIELRSGRSIERGPFRESFDLASIHRNLKAAGRFIFIDIVKNKNHLLQYVSPTLTYVKINLEKYVWLKPLHEHLSEYVKELR